MTNQEYTKKYHSLSNLHLEEGSLLRYVDGEGLNVGFVVDIGDAGDYGIEEYRSYPYKLLQTLNYRLKSNGLSIIHYIISERSLVYYISHFTSRDYRFIHQVKLVDGVDTRSEAQKEWDDYAEDIDQQAFAQGRESSRGGK